MDTTGIKDFFNAWELYDRVLDYNYMFHNEIYLAVERTITEQFANRPFNILDLGCGSARHLAGALNGLDVKRYVGCDISEVALSHARRNLSSLGCQLDLMQVDLADGIALGDDKFDLIFSSFALHHFDAAGKAAFFHHARRRLAENGILLLIDVARDEHEDHDAYMNAYCGWIQNEWSKLPQSALDFIFDHIRNNDFPESRSNLLATSENAEFKNAREIRSERWHHLWQFS